MSYKGVAKQTKKLKKALMNFDLAYCEVDDFYKSFHEHWRKFLLSGGKQRARMCGLSESEMITILILFHTSGFREFKKYYLYLCHSHRDKFPGLVSYTRFIQLMPRVLVPLSAYLQSKISHCTGVSFIDSTSIAVCHIKRERSNRVFKGVAKKGKTTVGWFYGFKVHLVINHNGELLAVQVTQGNVDDRIVVPHLAQKLFGKLFGDKGYISAKLQKELLRDCGIRFFTKLRKNMKQQLMPLFDKLLLKKRALVETVIDQLKNISQLEHTRHRSVFNFMSNIASALAAYQLKENKPSLNLNT